MTGDDFLVRKNWSSSEIELLRSFEGKKTAEEIGRILNRSVDSVKRKSQRLGIRLKSKVNSWNKEEEKNLIEYMSKGMQYKDIAKAMGRSIESVKHKAYALEVSESRATEPKKWSKDEEDYLIRFYNKRGIDFIANKFKRSISSVKYKAYRLGLYQYDEYISLKELSRCFNSDVSVVNRWKNKFKMPCKVLKRGKGICYKVDIEDFWKWAENNKDIIPWNKYESMSLLPQPDFVKDEMKKGSNSPKNHGKPVSVEVVRSIGYKFYKLNRSYDDICKEYGRSYNSVRHILRKYDKLLDIK